LMRIQKRNDASAFHPIKVHSVGRNSQNFRAVETLHGRSIEITQSTL
jgi:hypothetical protein